MHSVANTFSTQLGLCLRWELPLNPHLGNKAYLRAF